MALETRRAGTTFDMSMNGIVTGNVERNTRRNTPTAPSQSSRRRRSTGGSGSFARRARSPSNSCGSTLDATMGGSASTMICRASSGLPALRTARNVANCRALSASEPMR